MLLKRGIIYPYHVSSLIYGFAYGRPIPIPLRELRGDSQWSLTRQPIKQDLSLGVTFNFYLYTT